MNLGADKFSFWGQNKFLSLHELTTIDGFNHKSDDNKGLNPHNQQQNDENEIKKHLKSQKN